MKKFLLVAAVLLCLTLVIAQEKEDDDEKVSGKVDEKEEERKSCVERENNRRLIYATQQNIGNMRKLEYDKEMEKLKPMEGFECPFGWEPRKYKGDVWAINGVEGTKENPLATKLACIQHPKCGKLYLTDTHSGHGDVIKGKPGSECGGKAEEGLCIGSSAASFGLLFLLVIMSSFYF
ncbi:hypothetical protein CRE_24658 [Caenorhabditis remanei]|uniref:Uncharacterized protein n=1 Tax=Caenorhabditis remanei TaxID=31234 RepID=E3N3Y0_CAERE|nr:hypothetical protein CRE_24658 [Caenorhabditis remanei]